MTKREQGFYCKRHFWSRRRYLEIEEVNEKDCRECKHLHQFNWVFPEKDSDCKDFDLKY